ncbi:2-succinyl-6-hydroxy-2,4-cyclohexadiene-1-carboxylate synthase [Nodularia sphaerocarpa]|uniref:2-succinyl-6-hydroxy-2, 4-cyclohexadiene-1-carboxylate synthase n=1 Tax=Nodularia sphaerocarpa TaxID=137816 RepID=UPI001EFB412E|nr:2-succinyl-6-hydroxy-2,4-cyclohexadiene-1-carboxylate synthase [Nodularia sphaerocarpa]MDB9373788.1 2-succinyl-6-hydroxy-2,4-cyclohexadiene-1-carboxylate synthase [Nodularia sphaerocarpa CS-585]MDB9377249.1 2-succinyl-6-hydroxy-2,4-cyclohexadiene-1-carboxylate synthase [Nodularia sphaerocarpa CS-585A2]ULP72904.1 2-succinyl-6-hydroxy-2, 4-cyclohexadiene-1-carboxylate synthase [Nodularia sphaerocarpa UHCC 0038]
MVLNNYNVHYSLINNSNKPVILFLHGFMGNIHEFDEAIKILAEEFSFLTLDLPGHGKTQVLGGDEYYTMANTANALINLLDELKINQCFLVGYSMGGRLALYLTLHFPERFAKVILESASPGLATEIERLARIKNDAQIARKLARSITKSDFATFLQNWYNQPIFGAIKNHPNFEIILESRLQNNPIELTKSLQFMGTGNQPSLWNKLNQNTTPLLLLTGEHDKKFIDINTEIAQKCQIAQLKVINQAGHNIHLENTAEFVKNIRDFFTHPIPRQNSPSSL